jgi:glycosyltransferase involved in cell wall biosynthesis
MFHVRDYYPGTDGWTRENQRDLDALAERADLITIAGEAMAACLPARARARARLLENAADAHACMAGAGQPCPPDLAEIPKPRIGLVGTVNAKVDIPALLALSQARRDWQFVVIGRVALPSDAWCGDLSDCWEDCLRQPNIHWLGLKDRRALPAYMAHLDVNTMAYRIPEDEESWIHFINPLKMHSLLAAGKPVVSADVPAVRRFADIIDIVEGPGGWEAAIDRAIRQGGQGTVQERRAVALRNSWDSRVDDLEGWMFDMLSARSSPPLPGKR